MERTYIEKLLNKLNNDYGFNLKFGLKWLFHTHHIQMRKK